MTTQNKTSANTLNAVAATVCMAFGFNRMADKLMGVSLASNGGSVSACVTICHGPAATASVEKSPWFAAA